jgi:hypothetical protein
MTNHPFRFTMACERCSKLVEVSSLGDGQGTVGVLTFSSREGAWYGWQWVSRTSSVACVCPECYAKNRNDALDAIGA